MPTCGRCPVPDTRRLVSAVATRSTWPIATAPGGEGRAPCFLRRATHGKGQMLTLKVGASQRALLQHPACERSPRFLSQPELVESARCYGPPQGPCRVAERPPKSACRRPPLFIGCRWRGESQRASRRQRCRPTARQRSPAFASATCALKRAQVALPHCPTFARQLSGTLPLCSTASVGLLPSVASKTRQVPLHPNFRPLLLNRSADRRQTWHPHAPPDLLANRHPTTPRPAHPSRSSPKNQFSKNFKSPALSPPCTHPPAFVCISCPTRHPFL